MGKLNVGGVKVFSDEVVLKGFLNSSKMDGTELEQKHHNVRLQHAGFSFSFYFWGEKKDGTARPYVSVSRRSYPTSKVWKSGFFNTKVLEITETHISGTFQVGKDEVSFKVSTESKTGRSLEGKDYEYYEVVLSRPLTPDECEEAVANTEAWSRMQADSPITRKTGRTEVQPTTGDELVGAAAATEEDVPF